MHEIGFVLNIVKSVNNFAQKNGISEVSYVSVDIGELSGVMPQYVYNLWDLGTKDSICSGADLIIKEIPGIACCDACGADYRLMENIKNDIPCCPSCECNNYHIRTGTELMITEIGAR